MMDSNYMHHGDHFMIYVTQTFMPYTLNVYSDVCPLFLNKTGGGEVSEINIS